MSATASQTSAPCPPLLLLVMIATVGPAALNIFMPSMPDMQAVFDVDYATVQLTLTFYLVAMAVTQVFFGPLSDRFGRRPVVLLGLAFFIAGSALAALASSMAMLIAARMVQGAGGAAGLVLSRAIIRDCYGREKSASMIGYVTMGMVVGPMMAPFFGGLLHEVYGWQASFVVLVGLGLTIAVTAFFNLAETHVSTDKGAGFAPLIEGARILFASRVFWAYTAVLAFASAAFFAFLAAAPFIAVELMGLPPRVYGQYFPLGAIGYMAGNFLSGRYSERVGTDRMIFFGSVLGIITTLGLIAISIANVMHPLSLFLPMLFVAFSNGLVIPNAMANVVSVRPDHAGAASGLAGALQLLTGAALTGLLSAVHGESQMPMAIVMSVVLWIAFFAAFYGRRVRKQESG